MAPRPESTRATIVRAPRGGQAALAFTRCSPGAAAAKAQDAPWRTVAEASRDGRLPEGVRIALDTALAARTASMTVGERVALARIAEPRTRAVLAIDADRRVRTALLDNGRLRDAERKALVRDAREHDCTPHAALDRGETP